MAKQTETETTTEIQSDKSSKLAVLLRDFRRGTDKQISDAKAAYETARGKTEKAARALKAAEESESLAVEALVKVAGRAGVRLSTGEVVRPSCRGDRVFYRGSGSSDIV